MRKRTLFGIPRLFVIGVTAVVLAGGAYAFTASNTVASAPVGEGESGSLTGYTATSVVWTPDSANPTLVQKVAFSLSTVTASTVVYAGADNGTTIGWSSACVQGTITAGAATETCTFATEPTSSGITKLAVSAAN